MADSEIPSFSLGLDLALDTPSHSPINPPPSPTPQVSDSDPETGPDPPRRILKRLRRGPLKQPDPTPSVDADDDIEEFSSQDNLDQVHASWNRSVCSSSKVSLNGSGVLTPHPLSNSRERERKRKHASDISASSRLENDRNDFVFPKLTTSPLRRFQLIDSDSEDSLGEDVKVSDKEVACNRSNPLSSSFEQIRRTALDANQDQDLWKDFSPVKNVSVPTPAFNELCEEYFRSANGKEAKKSRVDVSESHNEGYPGVNSSCQRDQQLWESADPLIPAHRYFFHEDPRIRHLVCSRLHNFYPLGVVNRVNQQPNVSHIDYMGQFSNGGGSKVQGVQTGYVNNSTKGKNKSNNLIGEETFNASGGWVDPKIVSFSHGESSRKKATKRNSAKNNVSKSKNKTNKSNKSNSANVSPASANWVEPKSCTSTPKDAGKRRVQASGQSAGHWYTSPEGRKVYVNKSGQELTGRGAYRQYRKESGAGFKKSKKKTGAKKTNVKRK
ncbi:uncharacterized protein LOC113847726 [Abrus precatorius]|uniref:Uncharacterized protein LOC113847726 n=1 Tax=Abrus precatorius TaxID=3816 RepID=A0A8B8JMT9_ABRPR|nr:uncharacterized protein LOC113847726 [Abrus precatorius]